MSKSNSVFPTGLNIMSDTFTVSNFDILWEIVSDKKANDDVMNV